LRTIKKVELEDFIIKAIEDELVANHDIDGIKFLEAELTEYGVINLLFSVRWIGEKEWEDISYSIGSIEG